MRSAWVVLGLVLSAGCLGQVGMTEPDAAMPGASQSPSTPTIAPEGAADLGDPTDAAEAVTPPDAATAPSYLLSEDFESGLDTKTWTLSQTGATVVVDSQHAAAGKSALHVHVQNAGQNTGFANTTQRFALNGEDTFIRAFVYLEEPLDHHAQIFRLWASWANGYDLEILNNDKGGVNFFETWYYEHTSSEPNDQQYTSSLAPVGAWHCWEWEVNGKTDELQLWLDGALQSSATVPQGRKWTAPVDAPLSIGWSDFHDEPGAKNGFDEWIDDVVVSRTPIGCGH